MKPHTQDILLVGICLAASIGPLSARAGIVTLPVTADTFIVASSPNNNAGGHSWFDVGTDGTLGGNGVRRGLIRFDLSTIPPESTVTSAVVQLTVVKVPGGGPVNSTFDLFRLLAGWGEGNKIGNSGAAATSGEATWNARMQGVANWTVAGARSDAAATASASTPVGSAATYSWSGAALVSDVQLWVSNPAQNFGWLLTSEAEASLRSVRGFAARESGVNIGTLQVGFVSPLNTPPSVAITSPINGATFTAGAPLSVQATASDPDGTVTQVQFFDGATSLGTATAGPAYSITPTLSAGGHVLTAVATDNQGATTTSVAVNVTGNSVAASLVWIGGTGNWNIAANWSPAQVPTAADSAFITNSGTYTITVPAGTTATVGSITIGGTSGTQILAIDRATFTVNNASVVNVNGHLDFLVSQSVLTGPGNLTVNGTLNWANGTMSGAGVTTIGSGGVLAIGSAGVTLARTLNNSGAGTWSGGNLTVAAGGAFNNLGVGSFDITADGRLSGSATTPINNSGLFRQTAGITGTVITAPLNNSGALLVLASTLSLNLGGTHTGVFSNALGSAVNFGGGSHVLAASSFVTGPGAVSVGGNATTLTASGTFDAIGSTLNITAGTATLAAGCNVTGTTLNIGGGTLNFNTASSVASVNLSAGTLGGTSPVTVTGPLTLAGGTVTDPLVTANGGLAINGNTTLNGGKLINPGTAIWSAGNITGANGAVISNLFGATFINTFDGNAAAGAGATPTFVNAGLFQKTDGTAPLGTTSINFQFINTGTVEVRTNELRYAINQQTAGLTLLDGGALSAQAQPLQFLGGSLVGAGPVTVANTQNLINSATFSPGLPLGEVDITGNYQQTASGVLNIELAGYSPGTGFDLITVTRNATLGGTLNVTITNNFSPTNGATFTFLTTVLGRAGAFATFNYPSNDIGLQVNYEATSASLKVTNLKPVVANPIAGPAPVSYGSAFNFQFPANTFTDPDNDPLSYTASGMPLGIIFVGATRTFSGTPTQVGVFPVQVIANDGGSPNLTATNTFTITINPATLTITADAKNKTYGAADPPLTYTVGGLQFSDTPGSILVGALARAAGETVSGSPYAITQGTLAANGNYTINFTGNALTITPAALTIAAQPKAKTYGAADPPFTVSYVGFVNSENPTVLVGALSLARAPGENVGSYSITPGGLTSANYTITFSPGLLSITPAALTVTADAKTKTFGAADPAFTASYAGFVNSETPAVLGGTLSLARAPGENVGSYAITPSGLTSANYTITFSPGTLSITPAALTVIADAKIKTYGAVDPAFTASYAGFVNSETPAVLGGTLSFARAPGENVGSYSITPSGLTSANYTITFSPGPLSITPAALTVTADAKTKTFGAADPAFTASYAGFVNSETPTALGGTLSFARAPGENVGSYSIAPSGLTSANYTITFSPGPLSITKATLTVTADIKTKIYGAADPAFTASYAGFVNSETPAVLGGTLSLARAPGENVGSYAITPSGLTSANYTITFSPGTLSITPAALTVIADAKIKTYGAVDPAFTASYAGFVNSETPAVLGGTLSLARAPGENVGSYAITPSGLTSANYTITFSPGTLSITPAALTVIADAKIKTYGAVDPAFTASYAGFVNSETPAVLGGTLSFARAPGENVGSYSITPSGLTSVNYTITFSPGPLSITQAALTVTADAKTKTYGAVDPAFTASYAGFVNSETPAVLGGTLSFARAPGENVGSYSITPSGLTSANYTITFGPGPLNITQAALTVTADAKTKTYGAVDPAFTASYAGFVNSETPAVLGGTLSLARAPGENVGSYAITPSGLTSANYTITFSPGTLSITPAALTVIADAKIKTYGAVDPAFTASYAGFVNSETPAVLGGTLSFARAPGENVGSYSITPSGPTSANYTITFSPGTLSITKATLTVTADAKTKTYGAADPAFTASYAGFVNSETPAVLGGTLSFARAPGENVGSYSITPSGPTSANYTITFSPGTLSITKATLTVTADAKTKTYGAADPAFTASYTGFVNSDTPAVLGGTLSFARAPGENVGSYSITPSGPTSANYTITFSPGTLSITKATLTVTADAKTKTYGAADPAFTASYTGFVNSDTPAVLGGTLSFARAPGENVGSYSITPSGPTSANYTITFSPGTLSITKATLTVTADAKTKTYGAADPAFTASYAGFVNSETPAVLGGTLSFARAPGENVGSYSITPSGLTSANYTITFISGALSITTTAPVMLPLTGGGTATVVISWSAASNVTYRVQYKSDLNASNWTDLIGDVLASGSVASKTDIKTATNRFYRVLVLP